jgi:hypothetical protein
MTVMPNDCAPNDCWYVSKVKVKGASMECQRFSFDRFGNQKVALSHQSKDKILAGFRCETASDMLVAPSVK